MPSRRRVSPVSFALGLGTTLAALAAGLAASAAKPPPLPYRTDSVLVAFRRDAPAGARLKALAAAGVSADSKVASAHFARVKLGIGARTGDGVKLAVARLRKDPSVRIAEPNYIVHAELLPNDPLFPQQWALNNTGQTRGTPDADMDAPEAWNATVGSYKVKVAVIDTGVDYTHPDLKDNILRDRKGAIVGYNFAYGTDDPMDDYGHGTHVAGIIGARGGNRLGISGVSPFVAIMPLKFLDAYGYGDIGSAIQAIDFATEHGARVINNSWGYYEFDPLLLEAIQRARDAGVLVVCAAGNNAVDTGTYPHYPASYNAYSENVVSVAATDSTDSIAGFSNFGLHTVDVGAPGVDVLSTLPGATYGLASGTSMAAPCVSGVAAMVLSRFPKIPVNRLKLRLTGSVDMPAGLASKVISGRVNVLGATEVDSTPPAAPLRLRATHRGASALRLAWTAPGDDGTAGAAAAYELRYSTTAITAANLASAARASSLPRPAVGGTEEATLISALEPATAYFVALVAHDNVGNSSPLATAGPFSTLPGPASTLAFDNATETPLFAGDGAWAVTTERSFSPPQSYTDSPGTAYSNRTDSSLTQVAPLLLDAASPSVRFRAKTSLEYGADFLFVEVSADGGATWERQGVFLTGTADWAAYSLSLSAYAGSSVQVRFHLVTDGARTGDGVWLDDIAFVAERQQAQLDRDDVEGDLKFAGDYPWDATEEDSFSPTHSYTDTPGNWYPDNANSSLTQIDATPPLNFVPSLNFMAKTFIEPGYDNVYLEVSDDDGATWQRQPLFLTGFTDWTPYTLDLARFAGKSIRTRFHFISDPSYAYDGVWLDDLQYVGDYIQPVSQGERAPLSPLGLLRSPDVAGGIGLEWTDRSTNETAFLIERKDGQGEFHEVGSVAANVELFIDSDPDLALYRTHVYRVRATGDGGSSGYSNAVTVRTPGGSLKVATHVNFGDVNISGTKTQELTIRNLSATEGLEVTAVAPAAPFGLVGAGSVTVLPQQSRTLKLSFTPTATGVATGVLTLKSTDPTRPTATVSLKGKGSGTPPPPP